MTREEAIEEIKQVRFNFNYQLNGTSQFEEAFDMAIKALEQDLCEDCISRQAVINTIANTCFWLSADNWEELTKCINSISPATPQPKIGHCKDCKWWKDSDGVYRRGVGAESRCPINNVSVNRGFGYCYMFEPQEVRDKE